MLVQFFAKNYDRKSIWSVKTLSSYLQQFFLGENLIQPGVILVKKASLKQKNQEVLCSISVTFHECLVFLMH